MAYIVTGPAAVVLIAGRRRQLSRDDIVPAGADEARVKHLLDVGLITALPTPVAPDDPQEPTDSDGDEGDGGSGEPVVDLDGMNLAELREHAAKAGIDLAGATSKKDIVAAIQTAQQQ